MKEDSGTYYGKVYKSTFNDQPFFTVSRRITHGGAFAGVLELSVLPSNFFRFYSTLAYTEGLQYGRHCQQDRRILHLTVADRRNRAQVCGSAFRKHAAFHYRWHLEHGHQERVDRRHGAPHLIFGIPATLVMFLTLFTVLRRTMHLYQEIDRRAAAEEALRQSQKLEASARTSRSRLWGRWHVAGRGRWSRT